MATINVRKGQPFVILIYILGIVMVGVTYLILMKPMQIAYDENYNSTFAQDDDLQLFYVRSRTVVLWLPLFLIFPLMYWIFIKINERQQSY